MAKKKYVYFCETERFGYTLQVIGNTEEEAREAMIEEYIRTYKKWNDGANPRQEYLLKEEGSDEYNDEDADCCATFIEELYVDKREYGVVEWR